jgi:hypothetical protein
MPDGRRKRQRELAACLARELPAQTATWPVRLATELDGRLALKLALPLSRTADAAIHAAASGGSDDDGTAERKSFDVGNF